MPSDLAAPADSPAAVLARYRPALTLLGRQRWAVIALAALTSAATSGTVPPDLIRFARAGGQLLRGQVSELYADPWLQGGPFEVLGSWLLLPRHEQHLASFLAISDRGALIPMHLAGGAALFAALMLAVRWLRRSFGLASNAEFELLVGLLGLVTLLPARMWMGGHLAELAVPFCWVAAGAFAVRGRLPAAAVLLGLSAGWEPWAVLAAPLLLLDRRPVRLLRHGALFAGAAALPYLPFALSGRFELFRHVWPIASWSLLHRIWPAATEFSWPMRLVQSGGSMLAGAAVVLLLGRRREVCWLAPLAVLLVRLATDPLALPYYWLPFCVLTLLGVGLLDPDTGPVRVVGTLLISYLPRLLLTPELQLTTSPWALVGCLLLTALLIGSAARDHHQRHLGPAHQPG